MSRSLFFTDRKQDKKAYKKTVTKTVQAVCSSVNDAKAYTGPKPENLRQQILETDILPQKGLGFDGMLKAVQKKILPNFLRTSSTQYMAHLHSPALLESISSELILSTFNQSMDSWDQSPVATEVECKTVQTLCSMFGYDKNSDGCFTSGGSQSNITAVFLARDWFCKTVLNHDIKKHGLPSCYSKLRLYTSEVSHFSMDKACHLLGLGYDAVVKVPVDERQKLDTQKLSQMIKADKQNGNIPFCIVATIGTTDYGSIDDVEQLSKIAKEQNLWLHADAAYGSGLVMSKKYSYRMGPLYKCDSITVDFHKMFLLPVSCSAILIKDKDNFEPLSLHADYLNREEDEEDGYINLVGKSLQTTRRFDALKVWMSFMSQGKDGYSDIIDTCVENAAYAYSKICADSAFSAATVPEISSVVFRVVKNDALQDLDSLNKSVRRTLLHGEGIVIGQTVYNNAVHLKFTLLNPRLTRPEIDSLLNTIKTLAG